MMTTRVLFILDAPPPHEGVNMLSTVAQSVQEHSTKHNTLHLQKTQTTKRYDYKFTGTIHIIRISSLH